MKKKILTKDIIYAGARNALINGILPNPDKILRRTGKTIEAYRDLKNDPHVWSCIQSRKSGLLSLDYKVNPNGATEYIVKEIESILSKMDINRIEREILEAPLLGYQPLEVIWTYSKSQRTVIIPVDLIAKPQEWFFFDKDRQLRYKADGSSEGVLAPPEKIINVTYEAGYMNPYGNALLPKCYWPVVFKTGSLKFWVNFTEKFGMPILLGQYTRGGTHDEAEKLASSLSSLIEDSVIIVPDDVTLQMHEAARSTSSSLYRDLIKFCNAEISKAILSQTLTTELDMGSYAAAQTHFKVRKEVILSDIRLVESVFNRLIRIYIDLNYGPPYPVFNLVLNDSDNMQMIERDQKLAQTGQLQFTKDYWMRTYGFKDDEIV